MNRINRNSNFSRFLLENAVVEAHEINRFPIRGVTTESPIFINYAKLVQPAIASVVAEEMAFRIAEWDAKCNSRTTIVSGHDFSKILAYNVAAIMNVDFLPVKPGHVDGPTKIHGREIHITDTMGTGRNTIAAVSAMRDAGHECHGIVTMFDFEFNLHSKEIKDIQIVPLVRLDDYLDIPHVAKWKKANENEHLFGSYGRWQKPEPASL